MAKIFSGLKNTCFCMEAVSYMTSGLLGKTELALFVLPKCTCECRGREERNGEDGWRLSITISKAKIHNKWQLNHYILVLSLQLPQ